MRTPVEPLPHEEERAIGDIVGDIVDEGKAFARAELNLAKAMASAKASALKTPLILFVLAAFVAMAALNALAVAIFVALDSLMGHLTAGILAFLLIGGIAGLLGWIGYKKLGDLR